MKDSSLITIIGFIMYIILSIIDKFIYTVPNIIYIPIGILSIIFVLMGSFINLKVSENRKAVVISISRFCILKSRLTSLFKQSIYISFSIQHTLFFNSW